jgi:hypothetical protein
MLQNQPNKADRLLEFRGRSTPESLRAPRVPGDSSANRPRIDRFRKCFKTPKMHRKKLQNHQNKDDRILRFWGWFTPESPVSDQSYN